MTYVLKFKEENKILSSIIERYKIKLKKKINLTHIIFPNQIIKINKDHTTAQLSKSLEIQKPHPIPGIFTPAVISHGFLLKFYLAKPQRTSKNNDMVEKAKCDAMSERESDMYLITEKLSF